MVQIFNPCKPSVCGGFCFFCYLSFKILIKKLAGSDLIITFVYTMFNTHIKKTAMEMERDNVIGVKELLTQIKEIAEFALKYQGDEDIYTLVCLTHFMQQMKESADSVIVLTERQIEVSKKIISA